MISEYSCPFLRNTGKAYGNASTRPEGYRFHWKAKKHIPCADCGKPTASACGRCPLHVRDYYVTRHYDKLRRERTYVGQSYASQFYDRLRSEIRERSYEEIMVTYRNTLTNLNISLCRECLIPIKMGEGDYCVSCQPE